MGDAGSFVSFPTIYPSRQGHRASTFDIYLLNLVDLVCLVALVYLT